MENTAEKQKIEYRIRTAEKILIAVGRSAGIAIVSAILLVFIGGKISASAERIAKARGELASFTKKYEMFDQIKKEHTEMAGKIPKLESALPSADSLPVAADYLNALGAKTNNILSANFGSEARVNELGLGEIALTLRVSGTPRSIGDFLAAAESGPYFIKINNISLSSGDNMLSAELAAAGVLYIKNE